MFKIIISYVFQYLKEVAASKFKDLEINRNRKQNMTSVCLEVTLRKYEGMEQNIKIFNDISFWYKKEN